jgi:hypothetical protein
MKTCQVKLGSFGINLRDIHNVHGTRLTTIPANNVVVLSEAFQDSVYLWGKTVWNGYTGWFAIRYYQSWWVYGIEGNTELCDQIEGWPDNLLPPDPIVRTVTPTPYVASPTPVLSTGIVFGVHTVPGGDNSVIMSALNVVQSHGVSFGVKSVNDASICNQVEAAGGVCIYRSLLHGDCPIVTNDPIQEANRWVALMAQDYVGVNATYFELVNECNMDNKQWWNSFITEAVRLSNQRHWRIVIPSLNPGVGDYAFYAPLRSSLQYLMQSNGCLGVHNYSIYTPYLWNGDIYTSYRHRMTRNALVQLGLSNLDICITEVARLGGGATANEDDFVGWWDRVRHDPGLRFVGIWTMGADHTCCWQQAGLKNVLPSIANRIY